MAEWGAGWYTDSVMTRVSVDIGVNWVSWLREQAARHYVWDAKGQYYRVLHPRPHVDTVPARTLRDAWQRLPALENQFPDLKHNLFVRDLKNLPVSARARISAFFTAQGLRDFQFLDHGGRAITYRALHVPTGQIRVARMEAPHSDRYARPIHPVILQPFASNQSRMKAYGDMKLEILPEVLPLSKLYPQIKDIQWPLIRAAFEYAVYSFARGTNMMYSCNMFDRDSEAQNVGLRADGRVVSFDPEVITGLKAHKKHVHYKTPELLRDANAQQLALIYPTV